MKSRGCTLSSSPSGSSPSVVVAAATAAVAASRPAARNRNRQLGQSMPNVRHHHPSRRDFSAPTPFLPSSRLSSLPFLFHFHFVSFFRKRGIAAGRTPGYRHVSNATIYVPRRDFPLHRRTSVRDCGIYAGSRLTILSTAIPRRWFTCFANRIRRDRRYRGGPLRIDFARRNLINLCR